MYYSLINMYGTQRRVVVMNDLLKFFIVSNSLLVKRTSCLICLSESKCTGANRNVIVIDKSFA